MTVNRIRIKTFDKNKRVVIPIAQDFDESLGKEQQLKLWDRDQIENNINPILDFETMRFSPVTVLPNNEIFYSLLFSQVNTPTGNVADYSEDYSWTGIYYQDISQRKQIFIKSFFKFDFYAYPNTTSNKVSFSVIMPINNGKKVSRVISNDPQDPNYDPLAYIDALSEDPNFTGGPYYYDIESSDFELRSVGRGTENYYIQWLKDSFIVPDKNFYMSCKFFNAASGKIHRFINKPQPVDINNNPIYTLAGRDYFYYRIRFNRHNYTYQFFPYDTSVGIQDVDPIGGSLGDSIKFYEYINP
jgi:hypothetical protein